MKYRIRQLAERLTSLLAAWRGVECVMVNEDAEGDTLDPYFALILDVFYTAPVPAPAERAEAYAALGSGEGEVAALESALAKDRFLVGSVPVHIEFKSAARVDGLLAIACDRLDSFYLLKDSGTYGFYRLAQAEVLFSRGGWIRSVQARLAALPDAFWAAMREANQSKMEHFLIDLGEASLQRDAFNILVSSSGFIKSACLTLFCVNRRFEPSHRAYYTQVRVLPTLPDAFAERLDAFLGAGAAGGNRRYLLAKVLAMGIVGLQ